VGFAPTELIRLVGRTQQRRPVGRCVGLSKPARADKKHIAEQERELRRKDKARAETAAILVLRKKMNAFWGSDSEDV